MANPIFSPGDTCWHVRHGKVTLEETHIDCLPVGYRNPEGTISCVSSEGKELESDVGRVLYTLDEARQYGWLKEPLVVEFEAWIDPDYTAGGGLMHSYAWESLVGKRVRVRVTELCEGDEPMRVQEVQD